MKKILDRDLIIHFIAFFKSLSILMCIVSVILGVTFLGSYYPMILVALLGVISIIGLWIATGKNK